MANSMGFSANSTLTKWIEAEIVRRDITKAKLFRDTMTEVMNKSKAEARERGELSDGPQGQLGRQDPGTPSPKPESMEEDDFWNTPIEWDD